MLPSVIDLLFQQRWKEKLFFKNSNVNIHFVGGSQRCEGRDYLLGRNDESFESSLELAGRSLVRQLLVRSE